MSNQQRVWESPPLSVVRGDHVAAEYTEDPDIPEYKGNPLIEALPPIKDKDQVLKALAYFPSYSPSQRQLPEMKRVLLLENSREFFLPNSRHWEFYQSLENMIRRGYLGRNPVEEGRWAQQANRAGQVSHQRPFRRAKARGASVVGSGGVGKSSAAERNLLFYPQVITHSLYGDKELMLRQLVWMKLDCPNDGSLSSLCETFIEEADDILGTEYMQRYRRTGQKIHHAIRIMARVAANHFLGVLVIDEIQNLSEAKGGGAQHMLNFFVDLENQLGIPFVLIGTRKALRLFDGDFRHARRVSEQGSIHWPPMREVEEKKDPEDPDVVNEDWNTFVRAMWRYWYLKNGHPLPGNLLKDKAVRTLYQKSQGITALVGTIFFLAQRRAINSRVEDITPDVINSAVKDNQKIIDEMFERWRAGEYHPKGPRQISDLDRGAWDIPGPRKVTKGAKSQDKAAKSQDDDSADASSRDEGARERPGKSGRGGRSKKKPAAEPSPIKDEHLGSAEEFLEEEDPA